MKMFILLVLVSSVVNADIQKSNTLGVSIEEFNDRSDVMQRQLSKNSSRLKVIEDIYKRRRKSNRKVRSSEPKAPSTLYPMPH